MHDHGGAVPHGDPVTQLGTTLGTLAALRQMEEGGTGAVTEV